MSSLLEEQDRIRWDQRRLPKPCRWSRKALRGGPGPFALQAAIAALHCQARDGAKPIGRRLLALYDLLERVQPSPVVSLNRAVAVAMAEGTDRRPRAHRRSWPRKATLDELSSAARRARRSAATHRRLTRTPRGSYERALALAANESERRFLEKRLQEVRDGDG